MEDMNGDDVLPMRRILLYGDLNLNVMDGSAVWLVSMAEVLARTNSHVDLLLKHEIINDRLLLGLRSNPRVRLVGPSSGPGVPPSMSPRVAAQRMLGLDSENRYDVVVARGFQISHFVANSERLAPKAWLYVTDLPFPSWTVTEQKREALANIASRAKRMFAQTEDARSYLEAIVPEAAGKTILLPPMIPDEFFAQDADMATLEGPLRLVYAGKFAKRWRTLEMCELPERLKKRQVHAEVQFIGDKFQDDVKDPEWPARMSQRIRREDVTWLGGMSREDTLQVVRNAHVGLGWRDAAMDSSLEISTKALEYAASGVCPLLNRTAAHERLFGNDYPFFVDRDDIDSVVETLVNAKSQILTVRNRVRRAAEYYSMTQAAQRLESAFQRAGIEPGRERFSGGVAPLRVVLAGHDFKFAGELVDRLEADSSIELRIDKWATLHKHDETLSADHVAWADVVICEWAGPNAVWYSRNKRDGQSLIVRLHAFELRGPWLPQIQVESVDAVVCVSDLYRELTHASTAWPLEKIVVIPNSLDCQDLDRSKQEGYEFRLGLVGIVPFLKRPDRALSVLERLLSIDDRYTLHIRGRLPWEYPYEWNKPLQQQAYMEFFGKIGASSVLQRHVVFEPFGADMASWLSKIGYVLSPSTRESFHMAPAEGMASGAIPVVWDRPGAKEIFGPEHVVSDSMEAADYVAHLTSDSDLRRRVAERAKVAASAYDLDTTWTQWVDLLKGLVRDQSFSKVAISAPSAI